MDITLEQLIIELETILGHPPTQDQITNFIEGTDLQVKE